MIHMRTLSFKITFAGFSFLMGRSVFRFRLRWLDIVFILCASAPLLDL